MNGEGLEGVHNGVRGDDVVEVRAPKASEQRNHQQQAVMYEGRSQITLGTCTAYPSSVALVTHPRMVTQCSGLPQSGPIPSPPQGEPSHASHICPRCLEPKMAGDYHEIANER